MALKAIVLVHALLFALTRAGGQSGEGSGEECRAPDPRPEPLGGQVDLEGFQEPRCYLGCVENITTEERYPIQPSTAYPAWPMIPASDLERNCTINRMVQECVESCAHITLRKCIKSCNDKTCEATNHSTCQICERDLCMLGCDVWQVLEDVKNDTHGIPPGPVGPVELLIADGPDDVQYYSDAGLYTINPAGAIPHEQNSSEKRYPTSVVIRISKGSSGKIKYIWMASFEEMLNLTSYACTEISIQLGVVNKFGRSSDAFSHVSSLIVDVYGETPPTHASHPNGVSTENEPDEREGFWKHAVVNIKWKRPRKGFEVLDHYVVHFSLDQSLEQPYCKPDNWTKIQKKSSAEDDVKISIRAENLGDGPVSDCHYLLQVESISLNRSIETAPAEIHEVHVNSSQTHPVPLNPNSTQTWDSGTGYYTYKLDWVLPNDENVQRTIGFFQVLVDLMSPDGGVENLNMTQYNLSDKTGMEYHYSIRLYHDTPNYQHRIILKTFPRENATLIVLTPAPRVFLYLASALPPGEVEEVNVTSSSIKESTRGKVTIDFVAEWSPVEENTDLYNLRVVSEYTTRSNIPALHSLETTDTFVAVKGLKLTLDKNWTCLYIQVMAESRFMAEGNWSDPVCLNLSLILPPDEPTTEPPSPPTTPDNTSLPSFETGPDRPGSGDESTGQVVYIVVSVIVILVVFAAVLSVITFLGCYPTLRNRHRKRRKVDVVFMTRKASDKDKYTVGKLDQWEIYSNQVAIQSRLGEGAFGDVYRGLFNSAFTENNNNVLKFNANNSVVVAVKLLREDATDKDRQIFLKYILQAKKVAQFQHPHLVCMVGCVTEQEPLSLLTEYPAQGDLLTYLRSQRHEMSQSQLHSLSYQNGHSGSPQELPHIIPSFDSEESLQAQDLMLFISHVAAGLEHLASIGVVHGDVACRNLFLTEDKVVKISDFGLDSISEEEKGLVYVKNEMGRLPIRWMAIESIRDGDFSTASDVWAFGVTLWEIASLGGFPHHDTANSDILAILSAGQRLQSPTNCSEEIYGIMLKCCSAFPGDRPSFSTLHHVFKSLHSTANNGQYITLNIDAHSPFYLTSPRSSTIEPSSTFADDCSPLVETDIVEVTLLNTKHVLPHGNTGMFSNPLSSSSSGASGQHAKSASYSYSENGFLPCITEEGEDVSDNDDETTGAEDDDVEKRDSGNDSSFSHESRVKLAKESDRNDSEENLALGGNTATTELL